MRNIIIATISIALLLSAIYLIFIRSPQSRSIMTKSNFDSINPYISITFGVPNKSKTNERELEFYTYDLVTNKLTKKCKVPYYSQYGVGVVNLYDNILYYSKRNDSQNSRSSDNICAYDIRTKKSSFVETENATFNDIALINPKTLLVTAISNDGGIIKPALFNLEDKTYKYLYEVNNYPSDLYSTRSAPINYNYKYKQFVNIYVEEDEFYSEGFRFENKPIDFYIEIYNENLTKEPNTRFTINLAHSDILMATQISKDKILIKIADLYNQTETYNILELDGDRTVATEIDSPFPEMSNFSNCITLDDGKSFYVKGSYNNDKGETISGLFHYDCESQKIKNIILNEDENEKHVINFFIIN